MSIYRVFAGTDGESHIEELDLEKNTELSSFLNVAEAGIHQFSQLRSMDFHPLIEAAVNQGLSAPRIWQDLQTDYGFGHGYASVKRLVRRIKREHPDVADVLEHPPGRKPGGLLPG